MGTKWNARAGPECVVAVVIQPTKGKTALIDLEDLERVSKYNWCAAWHVYDWRAQAWINKKMVSLHRFIINAQPGQQVDHIHGFGLDCRKSQLRFATHSQNHRNTFRPGKKSTFKGVTPKGSSWQARIRIYGTKQQTLGTFKTAEEAARVYDAAALTHFGEFAMTNFLSDGSRRPPNLDRRIAIHPFALGVSVEGADSNG